MWAAYRTELRRRGLGLGASVAACATLGTVLWALTGPRSMSGAWAWPLIGAGCALAVGLVMSLRPVLAGSAGSVPVSMTQASALGRLAQRRRWASRARGFVLGVGAAVVVCAAVLGLTQVFTSGPSAPPPAKTPPAAAAAPAETPKTAPAPEPIITIGDHILVNEAEESSSDRS